MLVSSLPESERLFFALWPPATVLAGIGRSQTHLAGVRGRATRPGQLHLTLLFLGGVTPECRDCLVEQASAISLAPFDLELDTLGYWPRPQIVWLGSAVTPEPLQQLVNGLREGALRCGVTVEDRRFRVHLTLVRKVPRQPRLPTGAVTALRWPIREFRLMRSVPRRGGSEYTVLGAWPLR